jgi:peptidoglycan-N-acetylglucosamine deacetylase
LHRALRRRGLRLISWEAGGRDGWSVDPASTVARILAKVSPGAILVLHEGRAHSLLTILAVVDALLAEGYKFVLPASEQLAQESPVSRCGSPLEA